ncbi:MAG: single-stranded DNA-binding protein [Planctomycetota bacterium]|nr:single-stranded DNA-binding protein [Planctomycetota bacterium]
MDPVRIARELSRGAGKLRFGAPVTHVYNPLEYARATHDQYLKRYARPGVEALLVGMNPGPWGMAQTGVPFGEIEHVRDWLGIEGDIGRPKREHPKRPVLGFECRRSEGSGKRVWSWAKKRFGDPERFFERLFVWNYCPLCFMEESGRNRTPDKLPEAERTPLFAVCDRALARIVAHMRPIFVIGIGKFAEGRARQVLEGADVTIGSILHPSPASPLANRGWAPQAEAQLRKLGVRLR